VKEPIAPDVPPPFLQGWSVQLAFGIFGPIAIDAFDVAESVRLFDEFS